MYFMCEWFACMYVCAPRVCLMFLEDRRRCQMPWYWSYLHGFELPRGCREVSLGSLQEQQVFLTRESSLQPQEFTRKQVFGTHVSLLLIRDERTSACSS